MQTDDQDLEARIAGLQRTTRLALTIAFAAGVAALSTAIVAWRGAPASSGPANGATADVVDVVRLRRLEVVDGAGKVRISLGEDAADTQRRVHAASLLLYDADGAERGGFGTFADGTVILAMDAPKGVGSPMRDRLALIVENDGSAEVRLIDNRTSIPVRLMSPADGKAGLELMRTFLDENLVRVRRLDYDGEKVDEIKLGG